jgi:hypothetical protein
MITPEICQQCPGATIDMGILIRVPFRDVIVVSDDNFLPARSICVRETLRMFEFRRMNKLPRMNFVDRIVDATGLLVRTTDGGETVSLFGFTRDVTLHASAFCSGWA